MIMIMRDNQEIIWERTNKPGQSHIIRLVLHRR
jgi:hypothetical protein